MSYGNGSAGRQDGWQGGSQGQGGHDYQGGYGQGGYDGWQGEQSQSQYPQPQEYDLMMPQPTYNGGSPKAIRQPVPGTSVWAGFAASKSFKTGVSSILWLIFGLLVFIGPIVAFVQGIRAIIKGIGELIRAIFVGGFGVLAAIVGITLGLISSGLTGTTCFLVGRAVYAVYQAEESGMDISLETEEEMKDLFLHGKVHEREDSGYGDSEDGSDGDTTDESQSLSDQYGDGSSLGDIDFDDYDEMIQGMQDWYEQQGGSFDGNSTTGGQANPEG